MSMYIALGADGEIYNLCDCGDFDAADESALDMDIEAVWIWHEDDAREVAEKIMHHIQTYKRGGLR